MGIPGLTLRLINRGHWITMEQQLQELDLDRPDASQDVKQTEQQQNHQQSQTQSQQQNQEQSQQKQHKPRTVAIIDGPSLAYHIYGQYREENPTNSSAELSLSYSKIGAASVKFLEDMEAVGLQM